ncbi:terminase small subunit [Rhodobacter phage RcXuper]|nr:terminase small subunit [Rhodobacter phage RcXuper]
MPVLENPKHEEFALLLARGVKQGEAYKRAGYAENKGAASRLAASPVIQDRVEELKKQLMDKVTSVFAVNTMENVESLRDLGLTMEWVAEQFKHIYTTSLQAGAFSAANTAVENIKKLIEMERNSKQTEDVSDAPKFNMKDMLGVLDKVADVIAASKDKTPDPDPVLIDVTPKEE